MSTAALREVGRGVGWTAWTLQRGRWCANPAASFTEALALAAFADGRGIPSKVTRDTTKTTREILAESKPPNSHSKKSSTP